MTNYDLEELNLLNWQFFLSSLFVLSIVISLTLTYNQILSVKKETTIYSSKEEDLVLKFNRILASTIALGFVIINITDKNVQVSFNNCDEKVMDQQIMASIFNFLATLIVLYIAFNNSVDFDLNPEL